VRIRYVCPCFLPKRTLIFLPITRRRCFRWITSCLAPIDDERIRYVCPCFLPKRPPHTLIFLPIKHLHRRKRSLRVGKKSTRTGGRRERRVVTWREAKLKAREYLKTEMLSGFELITDGHRRRQVTGGGRGGKKCGRNDFVPAGGMTLCLRAMASRSLERTAVVLSTTLRHTSCHAGPRTPPFSGASDWKMCDKRTQRTRLCVDISQTPRKLRSVVCT